MTPQAALWTLSAASAVTAVASGFAEHHRAKRRDLDKPGWVPWALIQILAAIIAVVAAALALHT